MYAQIYSAYAHGKDKEHKARLDDEARQKPTRATLHRPN